MDINPLIESNIKLKQIEKIVMDLHYDFDMRKHGGLAEHQAINRIEEILNMPWKQGHEKIKRETETNK